MRTVRDLKRFIEEDAGGFFPVREEVGSERGERELAFWSKLNALGARNIATQPPEDVPDIDATVNLTKAEWDDLVREYREIVGTPAP